MSTPLTELPQIDRLTAHLLPFLIPARVMAANDVICQQIAARESAARADDREKIAAAVTEALDPGMLECGRLGMPCTSIHPSDRWCQPCRLRAALATSTDGGAE